MYPHELPETGIFRRETFTTLLIDSYKKNDSLSNKMSDATIFRIAIETWNNWASEWIDIFGSSETEEGMLQYSKDYTKAMRTKYRLQCPHPINYRKKEVEHNSIGEVIFWEVSCEVCNEILEQL